MEKIKKGNQKTEIKTNNMKISYITCNGKQPIYLGWTDMSREELEEKYRVTYNSGYNRGIRTGFFENESYGILGLDIDDSKKFDEFIQNKGLNRDEIIDTLTEETPSGSIHYYYKIDDNPAKLDYHSFSVQKILKMKNIKIYCYLTLYIYSNNRILLIHILIRFLISLFLISFFLLYQLSGCSNDVIITLFH